MWFTTFLPAEITQQKNKKDEFQKKKKMQHALKDTFNPIEYQCDFEMLQLCCSCQPK